MTTCLRPSIPTEFDHLDPTLAQQFNEVLAAKPQRCPIEHSDRYGGFSAVFTHEAVVAVASEPRTFSNSRGIHIPRFVEDIRQPPVDYDPPEHGQFRKVIQGLFTRQAVARYEDSLRDITSARIADLVAAGTADLIPGLAQFLPPSPSRSCWACRPRMASGSSPGLPTCSSRRPKATTRRIRPSPPSCVTTSPEHIARQESTQDDTVIRSIAEGSVGDGRPLTESEQLGMLQALVIAGHETTVASVGTMLYYLAVTDGLRDHIVGDPTSVRRIVDECLRIESPVIAVARTVLGEAEVAGNALPDGERVLMVLSSANRDEAVFDRPEPVRVGSPTKSPPGVRAWHPPMRRRTPGPVGDARCRRRALSAAGTEFPARAGLRAAVDGGAD